MATGRTDAAVSDGDAPVIWSADVREGLPEELPVVPQAAAQVQHSLVPHQPAYEAEARRGTQKRAEGVC